MWRLILVLLAVGGAHSELKVSPEVVSLKVGETRSCVVDAGAPDDSGFNTTIKFVSVNHDVIQVTPDVMEFDFNNTLSNHTHRIRLKAMKAGKSEIVASTKRSRNSTITIEMANVEVLAYNSVVTTYVSVFLGWSYFAAWSVCFYPEIYKACKTKSTAKPNCNCCALNLLGYLLYTIYNIGMYVVPSVQEQFSAKFPESISPVLFNDVIFAVHSLIATFILVLQCYYYAPAGENISPAAKTILVLYFVATNIVILLGVSEVLTWLDALYALSYLKLSIYITRYMTQVYDNWYRRATRSCVTGCTVLDFVGGAFSIFQMMSDGYNYNDWKCIRTNATKFGLGVTSIVFDIIFVAQYFCFLCGSGLRRQTVSRSVRTPDNGNIFESYQQYSDSESIIFDTNSENNISVRNTDIGSAVELAQNLTPNHEHGYGYEKKLESDATAEEIQNDANAESAENFGSLECAHMAGRNENSENSQKPADYNSSKDTTEDYFTDPIDDDVDVEAEHIEIVTGAAATENEVCYENISYVKWIKNVGKKADEKVDKVSGENSCNAENDVSDWRTENDGNPENKRDTNYGEKKGDDANAENVENDAAVNAEIDANSENAENLEQIEKYITSVFGNFFV